MIGWLVLLASPWIPTLSNRIAGLGIPVVLAVIYTATIIFVPSEKGDFGSFEGIVELFSQPQALLAGWIHFLTFDLLIGVWICRTARQEMICFWYVLPCLPITFIFGPAGFLIFSIIRGSMFITQKKSVACC